MSIRSVRAVEIPKISPDPIPDALAEAIRRRLGSWYDQSHRRLPWRDTGDPYRIWVSEIMLQQTQVATVIPYYHAFLSRFPDIETLAAADLQEVLKIWEGLGYYARARHLQRAAGQIITDFGGRIPDSMEAILSLPGVGGYVAAAVLSFAYDRPHAVVDGNVKRVLARFFVLEAPVNRPASHKLFQEIADRLIDRDRPARYNQAIMELGALVCRPKNPLCTDCPLSGECRGHKVGAVSRYPVRNRKAPVPEYRMAIGLVREDDRILIVRRPENGLLGGLWEFPGGTLDTDESPETALRRSLFESVHLAISDPVRVMSVRHAYSHFKIRAEVFSCTAGNGQIDPGGPIDPDGLTWVTAEEMMPYPFTGVARKIQKKLDEWI